jgi:hypothetical protein
MFILYAVVAALVVGHVSGGRLQSLATIRIRWAPLIVLGFLAQVVLFTDQVAARVGDAGPAIYVVTTLLVGIAVLRNIRLPGMPLIAAGAFSNMAAILANGGFMPATPEAMASLGKAQPTIYSNSAVLTAPNLDLLIDRFALPRGLPFANVFSIGDLLLAVGIFVLIVTVMHRRPELAAGGLPSPSPVAPSIEAGSTPI